MLTYIGAADSVQPAAMEEYRDAKTGARVRVLAAMPKAQVVYQTYPMWARGMDFFLFTAENNAAVVPHARNMKTGEIRPVFDAPVGEYILEPASGLFYFTQQGWFQVMELPLIFSGGSPARKVAELPKNVVHLMGGLSLDASGKTIYSGALLEEDKRWAIVACDLESAAWRIVKEVDFKVGHIQANPVTTGRVMVCWETGGESPQRMWLVNGDGAGLRPFYKETYKEWVTHEVWWGADRALFTVWPYDKEHEEKPYGAAGTSLPEGALTIYSQLRAWHIHGSPDKKWVAVDDFDRNIWLINAETKERRLLTQDHLGKGFDTHPHPSFTPDSKAVVFNSSRGGKDQIMAAGIPNWESLPKE
jgi:oligogalacturonide lyase